MQLAIGPRNGKEEEEETPIPEENWLDVLAFVDFKSLCRHSCVSAFFGRLCRASVESLVLGWKNMSAVSPGTFPKLQRVRALCGSLSEIVLEGERRGKESEGGRVGKKGRAGKSTGRQAGRP
uniref:F-box domain-containing protein n=1 Tax=Chromera velia CCMP2878 TaxID=1169474 RepID=A0A0G4I6F5_9ALVE|eukprot:Cvel_11402.t1-p1 / transcript=Cvel_11402.t1 / gene=Cvel_11402 / organism=Chromera_velia_CCMP2878 / gene_product=hypothetical protein / transcript_product=hypothetical protein / location=Cvel_scaffold715:68464-70534(+) / protein_length=121 / sequence_SO=supercontig / SO=protein_coding / is_pseudo=false